MAAKGEAHENKDRDKGSYSQRDRQDAANDDYRYTQPCCPPERHESRANQQEVDNVRVPPT
jgi:hypothetical protein